MLGAGRGVVLMVVLCFPAPVTSWPLRTGGEKRVFWNQCTFVNGNLVTLYFFFVKVFKVYPLNHF